jgi:membrane protein DedA with SNARE-associated domain
MEEIFGSIADWYGTYGYSILFLSVLLENAGLPIPGEAAVLVAGFLASPAGESRFRIGWVILLAFSAAVLGDNLGYWLGRRFARPRLQEGHGFLLLTPARLRLVEGYFQRHGAWTVIVSRFVTGVRVVCALAAGVAAMPWWQFFLGNAAGAVVWATTISLLGFFFGKSWKLLHHWLGWGTWIVFGSLTIVAGLRYTWVRLRNQS